MRIQEIVSTGWSFFMISLTPVWSDLKVGSYSICTEHITPKGMSQLIKDEIGGSVIASFSDPAPYFVPDQLTWLLLQFMLLCFLCLGEVAATSSPSAQCTCIIKCPQSTAPALAQCNAGHGLLPWGGFMAQVVSSEMLARGYCVITTTYTAGC